VDDIDRAVSALLAIDPGCPRDQWIKVGMAAKCAGISFDVFLAWSREAENFRDEGDCRTAWRSFDVSGSITAATLFDAALKAGWKAPTLAANGAAYRPVPKAVIRVQAPAIPVESAKAMDFIHDDGTAGRGAPARQVDGHRVQVLVIKKLTGAGIIRVAAKHNHRELAAELGADNHIDPTRSVLNRVLRGESTAAGVAAHAKSLMHAAGVHKPRKDAVLGIEFIFSLPQGSGKDEAGFFEAATKWVEDTFDGEVISAIMHLDESAPHVHVIVLPLVKGHMVGSSLVWPYGPVHDAFHQQVGQRFGLAQKAKHKRLGAAIRRQAIDAAFAVLQANSALSDEVLRMLLEPHREDPTSLMAVLNLAMPGPPVIKGSFVATMTKPCKPEQLTTSRTKPIGFDGFNDSEKDQSLCTVGFGELTPASASAPRPCDAPVIANAERTIDADSVTATVLALQALEKQPGREARRAMAAFPVTVQPESDCGKDTEILCALDPSAAGGADSSAAIDTDQGDEPDEVWVRERDQPSEYWDGDTGQMITPPPKPASAKSRAAALVTAVQTSNGQGRSHNLDAELWRAG
jgi:hypothetical protein